MQLWLMGRVNQIYYRLGPELELGLCVLWLSEEELEERHGERRTRCGRDLVLVALLECRRRGCVVHSRDRGRLNLENPSRYSAEASRLESGWLNRRSESGSKNRKFGRLCL